MVNHRHALADPVLGDIPDHVILGKAQRSVIGLADPLKNSWGRVGSIPEMIGHGVTRLDQAHEFAEGFGRRVNLGSDLKCRLRGQPVLRDKVRDGDEAFMNHEVRVLGLLHEPLVRVGVAGENKRQPVPVQPVAD